MGELTIKIDVGGVLVSDAEFKEADETLYRNHYTDEERQQYDSLKAEALATKKFRPWIDYKIGRRNRIAEERPDEFYEAFERVVSGLENTREAVQYAKSSGYKTAIHTTMNKYVSEAFRKLIGADAIVGKFNGEMPGVSIDDFEGLEPNQDYIDKYLGGKGELGPYRIYNKNRDGRQLGDVIKAVVDCLNDMWRDSDEKVA